MTPIRSPPTNPKKSHFSLTVLSIIITPLVQQDPIRPTYEYQDIQKPSCNYFIILIKQVQKQIITYQTTEVRPTCNLNNILIPSDEA